ncbi:MAG TPA: TolC family protein, partial [Flavobacteriales bacterium]|nr:TolC family protein [Flavobacteriales bacterium]
MGSTKILTGSILVAVLGLSACVPALKVREVRQDTPASYSGSTDTVNSGSVPWQRFFDDPYLRDLIDSALANNQELNVLLQEVEVARNEARARKGEYLP